MESHPHAAPLSGPGGRAWTAAGAFTAAEALAMDEWLVTEQGRSLAQLMAVAAARVAEAARALLRDQALSRVVFLAGPGNNGGDALVAEHLLRATCDTLVWQPFPRPRAAEELVAAACAHAAPASPEPLRVSVPPPLDARTLLVDGLFGVGLARPLGGAARAAVEHVNASEAFVLAIDIPSGLHATTGEVPAASGTRRGTAIRADVTLTFVGPKRGLLLGSGPALAGAWRAVDLDFPPQLAFDWLARRRAREGAK